jgi:hypothetical protein
MIAPDGVRLTSIVTGLPPSIDGVGDYALSMARLVREHLGIETRFIVADTAWQGPSRIEDFSAVRLSKRTAPELFDLLRSGARNREIALLHYSGYGYEPRGCPVWLVDALERWRAQSGDCYLVTLFHEVHASGPSWTSAFWLSPLQKKLAARLTRLSDQAMTSLSLYADLLARLNNGNQSSIVSLPVFSSIGERALTLPLSERARRMVVFGTRGRREQVYKRSAAQLNRICRRLGINEVFDIGRAVEFDISQLIDARVKICGETAASEISNILSDSIAGVIDYPAGMLGKSTIFAAYASHRVIPIVADSASTKPADGLEPSIHYWLSDIDSESLCIASGQQIADNAYGWYQAHSLSVHARVLAECLTAGEYSGASGVINAKSQG